MQSGCSHPPPPLGNRPQKLPADPAQRKAQGLAPPGRGEVRGPAETGESSPTATPGPRTSTGGGCPREDPSPPAWGPQGPPKFRSSTEPSSRGSSHVTVYTASGVAGGPALQVCPAAGSCAQLPHSSRPPPRPCPPLAAAPQKVLGRALSQPHHSDPVRAPGTSTSQPRPGRAHVYLRPQLGTYGRWTGPWAPSSPNAPAEAQASRAGAHPPGGQQVWLGQTWQ